MPNQTLARLKTGIAAVPPRVADGFYQSPEWKVLRQRCLERARYQCELALPGCDGHAVIADHIVSRKAGGADDLANLRAVCRSCDNRVKEDHTGRRRGPRGG